MQLSQAKNWLSSIQGQQVLVMGDIMLDRYIWGRVSRISPEAPVPVVEVTHEEERLGGAANVALNLASLGIKPILCGVRGADLFGEKIKGLMEAQTFETAGLLTAPLRPTTTKTRVLGNRQQVLRVDRETTDYLVPDVQASLWQNVQAWLPQVQGVIIQDYDKGVLSPSLIHKVLDTCRSLGVPTLVDPKFRQFTAYAGSTWFKPNLKELSQGLGLTLDGHHIPQVIEAIKLLTHKMPHQHTLVTLSQHGVLWYHAGEALHIPAHQRDIADVSGAGDTVISVLAAAVIGRISHAQAAAWANLAGGLVCEEVGVVPIKADRLIEEIAQLSL